MLRLAKRNGGWLLNGEFWMDKSRKAKAKRPSILGEKQGPKKEKGSSQGGKEWKGIRCISDSVTLTSQIFLTTRPPETHCSYKSSGPERGESRGSYSQRRRKKGDL